MMRNLNAILETHLADNQKRGDRWDALLTGAHLATMTAGYGMLADGAVAIAGGRIAWVGAQAELPGPPQELARDVLDLDGALLTPRPHRLPHASRLRRRPRERIRAAPAGQDL